jgi:hypothetical protein
MPLHPSRHALVLRHRLGLAAALLAPLFAAACSPSGDASPDPREADGADAAASASPDGGAELAPDAAPAKADAAPPLTARQIELARMQAHLDSLYAPGDVVHRFTTAGGDAVDCVPFQKQPGFAQVGSLNGLAPALASQLGFARPAAVAGFGEGSDAAGNLRACPSGGVPIRRVTINDLSRFATLEDALAKEPLHVRDQLDDSGFSHEHAGHSLSVPTWGAQVTLNLWKPAVAADDASISQLWIFGGTGNDVQTVEAGYIAAPRSFGDPEPRLFIYSTTAGYHDMFSGKACYNLDCKAFVQLADSHILLGGKFDKTSALNGEQREFTLRWQFCPATDCHDWEGWWLRYDGGAASEWVGFYPRSRYAGTGLGDAGNRIEVGGEVAFTRGMTHTATDMGSGQPPSAGFGLAAYQTNILSITTGNVWAHLGPTATDDQAPSCYASSAITSLSRIPIDTFFFGGAGYSGACQ